MINFKLPTASVNCLSKRLKSISLFCIASAITCSVQAQNLTKPSIAGPLGVKVNSYSGNLFFQRTDFYLKGRMPLDISFSYNSADRNRNSGFGQGWTFTYGMKYSLDSGKVTIYHGDGRKDMFTPQANPNLFISPPGIFDQLTKTGSNYLVKTKEGSKYFFNNATHKRLTRMEDRYQNGLNFTYTDSLITGISDDAGRSIQLTYSNGLLATVTEANGAPSRSCTYQYDNSANLIKVTDAMGFTQEYGYLINGPLNEMQDRNGNTVDIIYNTKFAVKELISCLTKQSFTYNPGDRSTFVNELVGSVNQLTTYRFDASGNLVQKSGNCCGYNVKYEYDNDKNVSKKIDANGKVYTYTYDGSGNMLTETDPLGHTQTYTYEPVFNNVTSVKDKNGNTTSYTYDNKGSLTQINRPLSITEAYIHAANGDVSSYTDGRGNATNYTYDAYGNLTSIQRPLGSTTNYTYDAKSRKLTEADPLSHTTTYTYNALDRVTRITDALTNHSDYAYDPNGNVITFTDANTHSTHYAYDALNRMIKKTNALGKDSKMAYDAKGNLTAQADENGNTTRYGYDELNRLISKANALNEATTYSYDGNGNVISTIYPNGNNVSMTYDGMNRLTKSSDNIGTIATYAYDNNGNKLSETDGNGNSTTYAYDGLNRNISVTDALGHSALKDYDKDNNMISSTDRNNHSTSYVYDALNRQTSLTDPLNYTTIFNYDVASNLTSVTDANSQTTSFIYDAVNRLSSQTYANATSKNFTYDAIGNIISKTDANGSTTNYVLDFLNRLTQRNYPGVNDDVFIYDDAGRMMAANNSNANISFSYDAANRVKSEELNGRITAYNYDIAGKIRTLSYPGGRIIKENYDERENLLEISENNSSIARMTYDSGDRTQKISYPLNGNSENLTFDAVNRITSMIASPGSFLNLNYAYDNDGNKLYEKKSHDLNHSEQYVYDVTNRLTELKKGTLSGNTIPTPLSQFQFDFDGVGNRTTVNSNGNILNYTTNSVNAYSGITGASNITPSYDNNGNLTFDGNLNLNYDYNDMVLSANNGSIAEYKYDALGRRIKKIAGGETVNYYYDKMQIIEICDTNNLVKSSFVNGGSVDQVLSMSKQGSTYFYFYNNLGSVVGLTDSAGQVIETYEYYSYGNFIIYNSLHQTIASSSIGNIFYFTGREFDFEISSYYYRERHFNPAMGRFNQRDPLGFIDGFNTYVYVGNNPINFSDPLGLVKWGAVFTSSIGVIGNAAGMFGGVLIAGATGVTGVGAVVGGAVAVKSAYGFGAGLGNLWNAFNDIDPVSTGSLLNDVAKVIDPCSKKLQIAASAADIALDLASLKLARAAQLAAQEAEGGLNLFKYGSSQAEQANGWRNGDYFLNLPNQGSPKLNWQQNYSALRSEMSAGNPIYDSYRLPNGDLIPTNGFLNAERYTLQSRGWVYNPGNGAWMPPN